MQQSANMDRKSLHKSITRGHLKPGVLMSQSIIHLIIDFCFNFHRYADSDTLIPFLFIVLSWQQDCPASFHFNSLDYRRRERWAEYSRGCESRCKKTVLHLDFLSHPAAHSSPKLYIITTTCAPRETVWNLIAIGNIRSKNPGVIEGFLFQFPRIPQVLLALFLSHQWGIHFHSGEKTDPVISNLLGGRGDGFTGSIITCYMERSIMKYE